MMDGKGILNGMRVTLKRFVDTYLEDIKWLGKRYYTEEGIDRRTSHETRGIFTIQYPEEKLPVPEEFRYIPFLVYDEGENGEVLRLVQTSGKQRHSYHALWGDELATSVAGNGVILEAGNMDKSSAYHLGLSWWHTGKAAFPPSRSAL